MSGMTDKISGKAKQAVGKVSGNDRLETEGKGQEMKGNLKSKAENAGDKIGNKIDDASDKNRHR